jgi:hypothetical protein
MERQRRNQILERCVCVCCHTIQFKLIISYTSSYKLQVTVTVTWCGVQNTAVISYTKFQPGKSQNIWTNLIPLLPLACWCKESLQDGPQSLTRGHRLLISEIELWMEPTKTQRAKLMIQNSWDESSRVVMIYNLWYMIYDIWIYDSMKFYDFKF